MANDRLFNESVSALDKFSDGTNPISSVIVETSPVFIGTYVTASSANDPHDGLQALKQAILAIDDWNTQRAVWRLTTENIIVSKFRFRASEGGADTVVIDNTTGIVTYSELDSTLVKCDTIKPLSGGAVNIDVSTTSGQSLTLTGAAGGVGFNFDSGVVISSSYPVTLSNFNGNDINVNASGKLVIGSNINLTEAATRTILVQQSVSNTDGTQLQLIAGTAKTGGGGNGGLLSLVAGSADSGGSGNAGGILLDPGLNGGGTKGSILYYGSFGNVNSKVSLSVDGAALFASGAFSVGISGELNIASGKITLSSNGAASFANSVLQVDSLGNVIWQSGALVKAEINADGSASFGSGNCAISTNGSITIHSNRIVLDNSGTASFASGLTVLEDSGNIALSGDGASTVYIGIEPATVNDSGSSLSITAGNAKSSSGGDGGDLVLGGGLKDTSGTNGRVRITSNCVPSLDMSLDLGGASNRWNTAYLSDISLSNAGNRTISIPSAIGGKSLSIFSGAASNFAGTGGDLNLTAGLKGSAGIDGNVVIDRPTGSSDKIQLFLKNLPTFSGAMGTDQVSRDAVNFLRIGPEVACPFVYINNVMFGEVLRNLRGISLKATEETDISKNLNIGINEIEIREEKDEVTYFDKLIVSINGINQVVFEGKVFNKCNTFSFSVEKKNETDIIKLVSTGYYDSL
ncbi:MAG: hypothetical protein HQK96_08325 [Nitrospirae bacterium]|nr:hypothetical protein [Nitrospirota bacterium]